jgi:NAD(P)-dependent dehydrogenase (short-subunit alcohol dehydrogenase family)
MVEDQDKSTRFATRVAIVTGGTRGIGRAISLALAGEAVRLVISYREDDESAHATQAELDALGVEVEVLRTDLRHEDTPSQLVETALQRFGRLDFLVNNAGITRDATLRNLTRADHDDVLLVNYLGAAHMTRAAIAPMIDARYGRIVNIASFVGQKGNFGQANYTASKAALIGFTKTAALELARHGITVNAVCPGFIDTDMVHKLPEQTRERLLEQIPVGRFGRPDEIAEAVMFALGSGYMTGAQLNVNGGIYM